MRIEFNSKHRATSIHPKPAPQLSHNKQEERIPLKLTFHPHNISVKNVIICYKNILSNFLVKSTFKSDQQPGTLKCARVRCMTCPFISTSNKISRTVTITDHFTCISASLIYCITCTLCKKIHIGETGRSLDDRFREHLSDVEINDKDTSKPVRDISTSPTILKKPMAVCGLSLHLASTENNWHP